MDSDTISLIKSALPQGRTVYYSFPDRHAFLLLENVIGDNGCSIADLKKSKLSPLLNKKPVKDILAELGSGKIYKEDLKKWWPEKPEAFRLTLGTWPELDQKPNISWNQITRHGWNIVLQLNFASAHKRRLKEMVPDWNKPLRWNSHPIAKGDELTLAWSRIDLDFERGEALIEEIQSDWVRDARYMSTYWNTEHQEAWNDYFESVLKPETKKWSETMLTAALWFILNELGLKRVFYHTYETGSKMKNIDSKHPPKSLYTSLPDKFCFERTYNGPRFIRDSGDKKLWKKFTDPDTEWYMLDFN